MNLTVTINIKELNNQRDLLLEKNDDEKVDKLTDKIISLIKENRSDIPLETIIEELTKLGLAPSVLYDDNGHFAISDSGMQTVSIEKDDVDMVFWVEKNEWFNTIREALDSYLDEL